MAWEQGLGKAPHAEGIRALWPHTGPRERLEEPLSTHLGQPFHLEDEEVSPKHGPLVGGLVHPIILLSFQKGAQTHVGLTPKTAQEPLQVPLSGCPVPESVPCPLHLDTHRKLPLEPMPGR